MYNYLNYRVKKEKQKKKEIQKLSLNFSPEAIQYYTPGRFEVHTHAPDSIDEHGNSNEKLRVPIHIYNPFEENQQIPRDFDEHEIPNIIQTIHNSSKRWPSITFSDPSAHLTVIHPQARFHPFEDIARDLNKTHMRQIEPETGEDHRLSSFVYRNSHEYPLITDSEHHAGTTAIGRTFGDMLINNLRKTGNLGPMQDYFEETTGVEPYGNTSHNTYIWNSAPLKNNLPTNKNLHNLLLNHIIQPIYQSFINKIGQYKGLAYAIGLESSNESFLEYMRNYLREQNEKLNKWKRTRNPSDYVNEFNHNLLAMLIHSIDFHEPK